MGNQLSREDVLNQLDEKVVEYFATFMHCAQSTFLALQEQFALDDGAILKALTPFPGIAFRGETCGAVVGSLMALGLVYGREKPDDAAGYIASLAPAATFCHRFEEEFGSTMCGDILESQLGKRFSFFAEPAEFDQYVAAFQEYIAAGGLEKCGALARKAVRIAAEVILDKG